MAQGSDRPAQCGRVVHVRATDLDRHHGLATSSSTRANTAAAAGAGAGGGSQMESDGDGGFSVRGFSAAPAAADAAADANAIGPAMGGERERRDVWCTESVPWLEPSAPARIGVGLDVARALAAVHALELPVGGTVRTRT